MRIHSIPRALTAFMAVFIALICAAAPAKADWLRAESERFVIYSDGDERTLRQYVQKLETFDRVLRIYMDLPPDEAPPRPMPIYLVGGQRELARVIPGAADTLQGIYLPTEQDIFAVARRARRDDSTLLHEYAHHFMFQNAPEPHPAWFIEGFAEYYSTVNILPNRVEVGRASQDQLDWLQYADWMPIEDVLAGRFLNAEGTHFNATYYPLSWLLTHWFLSDRERQGALQRYLIDAGRSGDPVASMQRQTGLTPTDLRNALRRHLSGNLPISGITQRFPAVPMEIVRLPPSANDLLLINQRLKIAPGREDTEALVAEVRDLAARHPGDPFARLVLGRAEILFGDPATGEAALTALLDEQPQNVEALQLLAMARLNDAADHPEGPDTARRQARGFLQRAYNADDANYYTFLLIAESRVGEPGYPDDNDVATWELAFTVAPQLAQARFGYAQALMARGRNAEAVALLLPMANDPHNRQNAALVRQLIERAAGAANRASSGRMIIQVEPDTGDEEPEQ